MAEILFSSGAAVISINSDSYHCGALEFTSWIEPADARARPCA